MPSPLTIGTQGAQGSPGEEHSVTAQFLLDSDEPHSPSASSPDQSCSQHSFSNTEDSSMSSNEESEACASTADETGGEGGEEAFSTQSLKLALESFQLHSSPTGYYPFVEGTSWDHRAAVPSPRRQLVNEHSSSSSTSSTGLPFDERTPERTPTVEFFSGNRRYFDSEEFESTSAASHHAPEATPPAFSSPSPYNPQLQPIPIPILSTKFRPPLTHRRTHSGSISTPGIHKRSASTISHHRLSIGLSPPTMSVSLGNSPAKTVEPLPEDETYPAHSALSLQGLGIARELGPFSQPSDTGTSGPRLPTLGDGSISLATARITHRSPVLSRHASGSNHSALARNGSGTKRPLARNGSRSTSKTVTTGGGEGDLAGNKRVARGIEPSELIQRLEESASGSTGGRSPLLVVDVRNLSAFLGQDGRVRGSVNVNFPSLLIKRFRKGNTANFSLDAFITTECGKSLFQSITKNATSPGTLDGVDIVVADQRIELRDPTSSNPGSVLLSVLERRDEAGEIMFLSRPFSALLEQENSSRWIVEGEEVDEELFSTIGEYSSNGAKAEGSASFGRKSAGGLLTLHPTTHNSHNSILLPRLNFSPTRAHHSESSPNNTPLASPVTPGGRSRGLRLQRIDTSENLLGPRSAGPSKAPRLEHEGPSSKRHPAPISIQSLCHIQANSPSASSTHFNDSDLDPPRTARPSTHLIASNSNSHYPPPTPISPAISSDVPPFTLSTIIPGFLFLGPEPLRKEDFDELERRGVKQILNLALECEDKDGEAAKRFEKCFKIPMRDFVEETGVQKMMEDACRILADAQLHSKPIYVHCRAGKSRSVTIVLAYLVHRNHWSLKRAYAHVSEHRKGISPNIGFVAELMRWEERERGGKSHGVFGSTPSFTPSPLPQAHSAAPTASYFSISAAPELRRSDSGGAMSGLNRGRMRDSLPPGAGLSIGALTEGVPRAGGGVGGGEGEREMEVRGVDGAWVPARRDPRDTNSNVSRRASRAGLESTTLNSWD